MKIKEIIAELELAQTHIEDGATALAYMVLCRCINQLKEIKTKEDASAELEKLEKREKELKGKLASLNKQCGA